MEFKKGETYYISQGPGKNYKIHIVEIVDGCMVVFKWYGRHKQWWHYEIKKAVFLELEINLAKENT